MPSMIQKFLIPLLFCVAFVNMHSCADEKSHKKSPDTMYQQVEDLKVSKIDCPTCRINILTKLQAIDGMIEADVVLEKDRQKNVRVTFDTRKTDLAKITAVLVASGKTVKP